MQFIKCMKTYVKKPVSRNGTAFYRDDKKLHLVVNDDGL